MKIQRYHCERLQNIQNKRVTGKVLNPNSFAPQTKSPCAMAGAINLYIQDSSFGEITRQIAAYLSGLFSFTCKLICRLSLDKGKSARPRG
ncbi:MAG TPA: hypothetical protein VKH40_11100 [Alloacidobacterium sp.]|nr:hypothetical protein [Alloacidobacterium sp.]